MGLQISSLYKKYLPRIFHSVFPGGLCKINLAQSQNILLNVKNYLFGGGISIKNCKLPMEPMVL